MSAGTYCNVQNNTTVTVNSTGQFTATLGSNTALAIYAGKASC
jgi:alpha-amylase